MSYVRFTIPAFATAHVSDHVNLIAAWRQYKHSPFVGNFTVEKSLTDSQRRRLPAALRECLTEVPDSD